MKKLLILGATYNEIVIIERARKNGVYTIVTDNNLDYSKSPAKLVADEAWDISWSDIDSIAIKAKGAGVDGVLAGFSEFRVENMIKLCQRLNLPCSLTLEQLEITRDKVRFKQLCKKYDIPCVPDYDIEDTIKFPVIVKPVDRAGSIGINVANSPEQLEQYYKYAESLSLSGKVIIEDFISDGIKVDFYYYALSGVITLLATSDTIMCDGISAAPILQKAWVFPSKYENEYLMNIDGKVKTMLRELGIDNGYITISSFYRAGNFYFFEAGFRLSGEMSFNFYYNISGHNYIDMLIDFALNNPNSTHLHECLGAGSHSVILNFFVRDGVVDKLNIPDNVPALIASNIYVKQNDRIVNSTNVLKKSAMFTLYSSDYGELLKGVNQLNQQFSITDINGKDLIYEKVIPETICESVLDEKDDIRIIYKPYDIPWHSIQDLLNLAHETNLAKGLNYATMGQSVDRLKEKVQNSIVLVALKDSKLVGTATIQFRTINHWYHAGQIGLLKLLAVTPAARGHGISSMLLSSIIELARKNNVPVIVSDSAEGNIAIKRLYVNHNFRIVDCCRYPTNNFVSVVYALWLSKCPWSRLKILYEYHKKRIKLLLASERHS